MVIGGKKRVLWIDESGVRIAGTGKDFDLDAALVGGADIVSVFELQDSAVMVIEYASQDPLAPGI